MNQEEDILHNGLNHSDYTVFRKRAPHRFTRKVLYNWYTKFYNKSLVIIGELRDCTIIQTSPVVRAESPRLVYTENSCYFLDNSSKSTLFSNGLPKNWKEVVEAKTNKSFRGQIDRVEDVHMELDDFSAIKGDEEIQEHVNNSFNLDSMKKTLTSKGGLPEMEESKGQVCTQDGGVCNASSIFSAAKGYPMLNFRYNCTKDRLISPNYNLPNTFDANPCNAIIHQSCGISQHTDNTVSKYSGRNVYPCERTVFDNKSIFSSNGLGIKNANSVMDLKNPFLIAEPLECSTDNSIPGFMKRKCHEEHNKKRANVLGLNSPACNTRLDSRTDNQRQSMNRDLSTKLSDIHSFLSLWSGRKTKAYGDDTTQTSAEAENEGKGISVIQEQSDTCSKLRRSKVIGQSISNPVLREEDKNSKAVDKLDYPKPINYNSRNSSFDLFSTPIKFNSSDGLNVFAVNKVSKVKISAQENIIQPTITPKNNIYEDATDSQPSTGKQLLPTSPNLLSTEKTNLLLKEFNSLIKCYKGSRRNKFETRGITVEDFVKKNVLFGNKNSKGNGKKLMDKDFRKKTNFHPENDRYRGAYTALYSSISTANASNPEGSMPPAIQLDNANSPEICAKTHDAKTSERLRSNDAPANNMLMHEDSNFVNANTQVDADRAIENANNGLENETNPVSYENKPKTIEGSFFAYCMEENDEQNAEEVVSTPKRIHVSKKRGSDNASFQKLSSLYKVALPVKDCNQKMDTHEKKSLIARYINLEAAVNPNSDCNLIAHIENNRFSDEYTNRNTCLKEVTYAMSTYTDENLTIDKNNPVQETKAELTNENTTACNTAVDDSDATFSEYSSPVDVKMSIDSRLSPEDNDSMASQSVTNSQTSARKRKMLSSRSKCKRSTFKVPKRFRMKTTNASPKDISKSGRKIIRKNEEE